MVDLHLNPVDYRLFIVSIVSCRQLKGREHDLALAGLSPHLVFIYVLTHLYPDFPHCLNLVCSVRREGILRTLVTCLLDRLPHNVVLCYSRCDCSIELCEYTCIRKGVKRRWTQTSLKSSPNHSRRKLRAARRLRRSRQPR